MPDADVLLGLVLGRHALPLTLRLHDPQGQEVAGGGYAPRALALQDWALRGGAALAEHLFRFGGRAGPVAGWHITTADGAVLHREDFADGPYDVRVIGSTIRVEAWLEIVES